MYAIWMTAFGQAEMSKKNIFFILFYFKK